MNLPFPSPPSLADAVHQHATLNPQQAALCAAGVTYSYAALADQSAGLAAGFATALARNAHPEPICALAAPAVELALAAVAASAAGCTLLPLDPAMNAAQQAQLRAIGAGAIDWLPALPPPGKTATPPSPAAQDAPALAIASSGSSGIPRITLLSGRALQAAAAASARVLPLAPGDVWLCCLPLHHIGGQMILWRCFSAGATVQLCDPAQGEALAAALESGVVSHVSLVPAMLGRLLAAGVRPHPALRVALIGGSALSPALYAAAQAANWPLHVSYGMSETAAMIALLPPDTPWQPGRVGRLLPGIRARITADGRLAVRGAQLFSAYLGQPSALDADGWFVTGDHARLDDHNALTILGRADTLLISGGVNVDPEAVEAILAECPEIGAVAVSAIPDPLWGDRLVAIHTGSASSTTILAWARNRLPSPQRPRHTLRIDALPRTALGKIARGELRTLLAEQLPCP